MFRTDICLGQTYVCLLLLLFHSPHLDAHTHTHTHTLTHTHTPLIHTHHDGSAEGVSKVRTDSKETSFEKLAQKKRQGTLQ
jgi:hypothetical protein